MADTINLKRILSVEECKNYITAGKCKVTLKSQRTGDHFTFKVRVKKGTSTFYVEVLSGVRFYTYVGLFGANMELFGKNKTSKSFRAFRFLLKNLRAGELHPELEVLKSSVCCKCGRDLTTPESIEDGIGPECKKMLTKIGKW